MKRTKPGHNLQAMADKLMGGPMPKVDKKVMFPKAIVLAVAQALLFRPPPALVTMQVGQEVVRYKVEARHP